MSSRLFAAALALVLPHIAEAAPVTIEVHGPNGGALPDAVVMIDVPGTRPAAARGPYVMEQKAIAFRPHVLVVPVGASVSFPNRDTVRHHVYSFSRARKFDLKLYGREDQRSVVFDQAGIVALGCNIHDSMSGFIVVTPTPYVAKTDATGRVALDVPAGDAVVRVWSPAIHARDNIIAQPVTIAAAGFAKIYTVR